MSVKNKQNSSVHFFVRAELQSKCQDVKDLLYYHMK